MYENTIQKKKLLTAFKCEAIAAQPTDKLKDWAKPRMGR